VQQVIGQILPLAVGIDISALSIAAVILMLGTTRARSNGLTFLVGWMVGLFVVGGLALVLASAAGLSSSTDSTSRSVAVINLVLGVLLVVLAARGWRSRPRSGEEPPLPQWMASLDTITPSRSASLAALLSGINPKNLALNSAAMSIIASADSRRRRSWSRCSSSWSSAASRSSFPSRSISPVATGPPPCSPAGNSSWSPTTR
jgi:threonine/homoserine/homoserine lactone efflux protein